MWISFSVGSKHAALYGMNYGGLNNDQYYGSIFLIELQYMAPQMDLKIILVIFSAPILQLPLRIWVRAERSGPNKCTVPLK